MKVLLLIFSDACCSCCFLLRILLLHWLSFAVVARHWVDCIGDCLVKVANETCVKLEKKMEHLLLDMTRSPDSIDDLTFVLGTIGNSL